KTQVEEALAELVAGGLITADSFTGLRALLTPSNKRPSNHNAKRKAPAALFGMENAGRWSRLQRRGQSLDSAGFLASGRAGVGSLSIADGAAAQAELIERIVRVLLRRYGVVFRKLMDREGMTLPWRELLRALRRLEARGEIRGGRFVAGVSGEQFALNEAVSALRSIRRKEPDGALISVSAADPLNLVGIVLPGARVPVIPTNRILYRDGVPIAVLEAGQERYLVDLEKASQWPARKALIHRPVPPQLKAYLGRSAQLFMCFRRVGATALIQIATLAVQFHINQALGKISNMFIFDRNHFIAALIYKAKLFFLAFAVQSHTSQSPVKTHSIIIFQRNHFLTAL